MSIEDFIGDQGERFLEELTAYCRIPSVAAEGRGIVEAAAWVADRLSRLTGRVEVLSVPDGPPVVVAELGPADASRRLLIYNHYDVQPADPLEEWLSDPFEPEIRDGKLYARGTADNKANFLSRVHAVEAWRDSDGELPIRITWLIEGEEEVGSPTLDLFCRTFGDRWSDVDGCLWESGRRDEHDRVVLYSGLKGIAAFELRLRGASSDSHSSAATLIPNPAWRMIWLLATLKAPDERILIDGFMEQVAEPTEAERRYVSSIPFDDQAMRATYGVDRFVTGAEGDEALLRHLYQPTCTVCGIGSGYSGPGMKTVLPSEAFAKLDFRLVPDLTPRAVEELLRAHLDRHGFEDAQIVGLEGEHPVRGDIDSEVVAAAAEAVRRVTSRDPVVLPHMVATGPMHPVAASFGIPAVGFGTGYFGSNIHAPNEHIRLDDYFEGVHIAARFYECLAES